jgi:hypothetical protein
MKIPPFVKTLNLSENIGVTTPPTKAATAELFQNVAASLAHSLCTTSDVVVVKNSSMATSQQSKPIPAGRSYDNSAFEARERTRINVRGAVMRVWTIIGLLFTAATVATIPVSPQATQRGVELRVDQAQAITYGRYRRVTRRAYRRAAYAAAAAGVAGYGYGSSYYSSYYAPQPYSSYYRPVDVRTVYYPYPPPGGSYYVAPFASVNSYGEYLVRR